VERNAAVFGRVPEDGNVLAVRRSGENELLDVGAEIAEGIGGRVRFHVGEVEH
jgi:hypothetical protein